MCVASHNCVEVIASNGKDGPSHFVEKFADLKIQDADIHAANCCVKIIAGTGSVLLTADFNSDFTD